MKTTEEFTSCKVTRITYNIYTPRIQFRHYGIVQIIHPFGEHIERYDHFARFLCEKGYIVVVSEYLGHFGALLEDELGYFGKEYGWEALLTDLDYVRNEMQSRYPDLAYFMLSVGSANVLLQSYMIKYGDYLQGAIMVGMFDRGQNLLAKQLILRLDVFVFGNKHHSQLMDRMVFGHVRQVRHYDTKKLKFMSRDEQEIINYIEDSKCGFIFTSQALLDIITGMRSFSSTTKKSRIFSDFPVLLLNGGDDPIGGDDRYTRFYAKLYRKAGIKDVQYYTYASCRHFLLHDTQKLLVYDDILAWLTDHVYR